MLTMLRYRLIWCAVVLWAGLAHADKPPNITVGEVALLPEYCQDTLTFATSGGESGPNERQRRWIGAMGRGFWAMHHYCWALVSEYRASAAGVSPQMRDYLLKSAIEDSHFVLAHSQPGFVMLPEVYTRMGDFSIKRKRLDEAHVFFSNAREAKPDYWPPYVRQAQMLMSLNEWQSARRIIETGLGHMPDQPQLLEVQRQLHKRVKDKPVAAAASSPK